MRCKIYAWAWFSELKLSWSLVFWEGRCFMGLKQNEMQQQGLSFFTGIIRETNMAWDLIVFSAELLLQGRREVSPSRASWRNTGSAAPGEMAAAEPGLPSNTSPGAWVGLFLALLQNRRVGSQAPCLFRKMLAEKRLNQNMLTVIICYGSYLKLRCPCPLFLRPLNFAAYCLCSQL